MRRGGDGARLEVLLRDYFDALDDYRNISNPGREGSGFAEASKRVTELEDELREAVDKADRLRGAPEGAGEPVAWRARNDHWGDDEPWALLHTPSTTFDVVEPLYASDLRTGREGRDHSNEEDTMNGVERIARERGRQVDEEGWTPKHDDHHDAGELAVAAALLAVDGTDATVDHPDFEDPPHDQQFTAATWMEELAWKHSYRNDVTADKPTSPVRRLEIAGALIAAEIDRLRRLRTGREG